MSTESPRLQRYPNGFELLLVPNSASPALALDLWVRVGSADEPSRHAGISHVVEHMLFKGTPSRPVGAIAQEIEAVGGDINAYTTFDYTAYSLVVASRYAELALDILADAVFHSCFDAEELEREKAVILEELFQSEDLPQQYLSQQLSSAAFRVHPYGRPVIGYPTTLEAITTQACLQFWHHWYQPNNMILVAAGDVTGHGFSRAVAKRFGQPPADHSLRRPRRRKEPRQHAFQCLFMPRDVQETYFELAFPGLPANHPATPAMDLLVAILGQGEASRLQQRVKLERNLVHGVGAGSYTPLDRGLLQVSGASAPENLRAAYEAVCTEVFRLMREPIGSKELHRARENLEADFIYQKETVEGLAEKAGFFHVVCGSCEAEQDYLDALARVDSSQLQALARKYFCAERAILAVLHPENHLPPWTEREVADLTQQIQRSASRRLSRRSRRKGICRQTLDNGLRILVKENAQVPVVAMRAAIRGGLISEPASQAGAFHVLAQCWVRGTSSRDLFDVARTSDALSGQIDGFSGRNSFGLRSEFLSKHLEGGLDLFADVLCHPTFPSAEVAKICTDAAAATRLRDDDPTARTWRNFEALLYGEHPFGRDILGLPQTVAALRSRDIQHLYARSRCPQHCTIAVAGDVDADRVLDFLVPLLSAWEPCGEPVFRPPPPPAPTQQRSQHTVAAVSQAHIVMGYLGVAIDDERRFPLRVLTGMLSGQGGRLFRRLREELGLAYEVECVGMEGVDPGYIAAHLATGADRMEQALAALAKEFDELAAGRFSPVEVADAQRKLVGSYEIALQENVTQATQLALDELLRGSGSGLETFSKEILRVTPAQVAEVATHVFRGTAPVVATLSSQSNP